MKSTKSVARLADAHVCMGADAAADTAAHPDPAAEERFARLSVAELMMPMATEESPRSLSASQSLS